VPIPPKIAISVRRKSAPICRHDKTKTPGRR
jgi:hypothetical protein